MPSFMTGNGDMFFWLGVVILSAVVEGATMGLVSIWFVPGALVAMLIAGVSDLIWLEAIVFAVLSVLSLIFVRKWFKEHPLINRRTKLNADRLEGKCGIIEETVDNIHATGSVRIEGIVWTARTEDPELIIEPEAVVEIVRIEGNKLIVKPYRKTEKTN